MIKTEVKDEGRKPVVFGDVTVDDTIHRIRELLNEGIALNKKCDNNRQLVVYIGMGPPGETVSLPRKPSPVTQGLDVDEIAIAAIVDRALHLLGHPSIKNVILNVGDIADVDVHTVGGRRFKVKIEEE